MEVTKDKLQNIKSWAAYLLRSIILPSLVSVSWKNINEDLHMIIRKIYINILTFTSVQRRRLSGITWYKLHWIKWVVNESCWSLYHVWFQLLNFSAHYKKIYNFFPILMTDNHFLKFSLRLGKNCKFFQLSKKIEELKSYMV